ncbi:hypothetical protein [Nocardia sp. CA-120079]|uniref:hypothetical protein n=1 Tax=Nocardia sp. CA-120079 TaxID=3239974 RepID=UPI003D973DF9
MHVTRPEALRWTTTIPLLTGWHRFAALVARYDLARSLRRIGEIVARSEVLTGRTLAITVTWHTHEGTDRGHLTPTVRTVRNALTAAGIDTTGATITPQARATTEAIRPGTPALTYPELVEAITPRVVVEITTN